MLNTNIMNKESNRIRNRGGKEDITDIIVCWCSVGFSSSRRTTAATTHSIQNDLTYAAESWARGTLLQVLGVNKYTACYKVTKKHQGQTQ